MARTKHFQGIRNPKRCVKCNRKRGVKISLTDDSFWKIECPKCGELYY